MATFADTSLVSIRGVCFTYDSQLSRLLGLTHDDASDEAPEGTSRKPQGRAFVTPLTRLQHQANLPRSPRMSYAESPGAASFRCDIPYTRKPFAIAKLGRTSPLQWSE